jgi:hypothetical protein
MPDGLTLWFLDCDDLCCDFKAHCVADEHVAVQVDLHRTLYGHTVNVIKEED